MSCCECTLHICLRSCDYCGWLLCVISRYAGNAVSYFLMCHVQLGQRIVKLMCCVLMYVHRCSFIIIMCYIIYYKYYTTLQYIQCSTYACACVYVCVHIQNIQHTCRSMDASPSPQWTACMQATYLLLQKNLIQRSTSEMGIYECTVFMYGSIAPSIYT